MTTRGAAVQRSGAGWLLRGVAAGLIAGGTMNLFARAVAAATRGREGAGAAPGNDRSGRGVQPAQAEVAADDDAAVRIGSLVYEASTSRHPAEQTQRWLGSATHYAFSAAAGVSYAALARRFPAIRSGSGVGYGTLVWALADEGVVPALGLSRRPAELSAGVHLYALLGHWVYGATLDALLGRPRRERLRPN